MAKQFDTKAQALATLKRQTTPAQRKDYKVVKVVAYEIHHKRFGRYSSVSIQGR